MYTEMNEIKVTKLHLLNKLNLILENPTVSPLYDHAASYYK